jgi:hypothetical protein
MHDEDNAIGLSVQNPNGTAWTMYGDKRLLDRVDVTNRNLVIAAVQTSADEIFEAWFMQRVPNPSSYRAWYFAPTLASARAYTQVLAPLFTFEAIPRRRSVIANRRQYIFTSDYWYWSTSLACATSGLWNYPITIGGASVEADDQWNDLSKDLSNDQLNGQSNGQSCGD